ncbi:serine/threonine-protein phosphatase 7 long form homolog [Gastrolobium bilobum]|uniref:serine/threonine-protein phosphatase 7 long form homolog n=1 Tax=Gastrolobium bilobum TaxID=150636 RepID=UPI002AB1CDE7|nr:serine/threonine-protein phosphatase 7 long form homolog [Gastrolobium bilobum]
MNNATEQQRIMYTRALIMRVLRGLLFVDTASSYVPVRFLLFLDDFHRTGTFSWGSAVLAYLYRELARATDIARSEMGGCVLLLQLWAWKRLRRVAPPLPDVVDQEAVYGHRFNVFDRRQHRSANLERVRFRLDVIRRHEIVWLPHRNFHAHHLSSDQSRRWLAICPLIYYHIVVYQQPDRVLRQFWFRQPIPAPPVDCPPDMSTTTLRGKPDVDWTVRFAAYVAQWNDRDHLVVENLHALESEGHLSVNSRYIQWYRGVTRRWLTQRAAEASHVADRVETVYYMVQEQSQSAFSMESLRHEAERALSAVHEGNRITEPVEDLPPPSVRHT